MTSNNPIRKLLGGEMYNQINKDILRYHEVFYGGNKMRPKTLSTGNNALNDLLHGGYKKGKLTEISGASNTGKTLLALKAIKEVQKDEKISIYIDTSNSFSSYYLTNNNIDEDSVILIQPNTAEQIGIILSEIVKPNIEDIGLIILDDLAHLTTKHELESSINKNTDIHRSKVVKALLTRISNLIRNTDVCALILNQNRNNFLADGTINEISSFERWVKMTCDTRLKLSIDEDKDICVEVNFKENKIN